MRDNLGDVTVDWKITLKCNLENKTGWKRVDWINLAQSRFQ
jgi:hypothetical protein